MAMQKLYLRVHKLYSLCKNPSHSHMKLYTMLCKCRHDRSMIYHKCPACHLHCWSATLSMLSCWFKVSCHQVVLSVCSKGHVCKSSLAHTLSHFAETLSIRPPSNSWTSTELHCVVSALTDHVLLPRIFQSPRLSPRWSTLHNPGVDPADYHLEQRIIFSISHSNMLFPQGNLSSL